MVKIDKHISDLLFRYDCVIVPDFGGFVANYAPAKIHPTQHTFDPPSKNIVFNKNLRNNDGLLANHIANTEQKTYNEATTVIHHYVEDFNSQLRNGKRIKIERVGDLFLNVERNIQFEPDRSVNYLTDSFGLTAFQSPAIKRGGHVERIEKEFKDRVIPESVPVKRKINVKRYVAMAVVLPFIFAMVWIPLKTDLLKNVNYSNLNPFGNKEKAMYAESNITNNEAAFFTKSDFETGTSALADNTSPVVNLKFGDSNIAVRLKEDTVAVVEKPDNTNVVVSTAGNNKSLVYHIVAGCFKIADNATNFVKQLKEKNLAANIIGQNENGLNIVSVGDYATKEEAERAMVQLRSKETAVWVLKK